MLSVNKNHKIKTENIYIKCSNTDQYMLDSYLNVLNNFAYKYEMLLIDIEELFPYQLYIELVKESNSNVENIINNSFKLIQKRLFLSDYDIFQPTGKITI